MEYLIFKGDVKVTCNVVALNIHDKETTSQLDIAKFHLRGKKLTKHTDVTGAICKGNLV